MANPEAIGRRSGARLDPQARQVLRSLEGALVKVRLARLMEEIDGALPQRERAVLGLALNELTTEVAALLGRPGPGGPGPASGGAGLGGSGPRSGGPGLGSGGPSPGVTTSAAPVVSGAASAAAPGAPPSAPDASGAAAAAPAADSAAPGVSATAGVPAGASAPATTEAPQDEIAAWQDRLRRQSQDKIDRQARPAERRARPREAPAEDQASAPRPTLRELFGGDETGGEAPLWERLLPEAERAQLARERAALQASAAAPRPEEGDRPELDLIRQSLRLAEEERRAEAAERPPPEAPPPPPPEEDDGRPYEVRVAPPGPPLRYPADWGARQAPLAPYLRTAAVLGAQAMPGQIGLLCTTVRGDLPVALTLDGCVALGFFGVPRSGKSYASAAVVEMAVRPHPFINDLRRPLCALAFHYHPGASYEPELLASAQPNRRPDELTRLLGDYRALPAGLPDIVVLTLPGQVAEMRRRHPQVQVHGIQFPLRELGTEGLRLLLGVDERDMPQYARVALGLLERLQRERPGQALTMVDFFDALRAEPMEDLQRRRLLQRLEGVLSFVDDGRSMRKWLRPGRLVIVDIRDEWISRDRAMMLFGLLTQVLVLHPDRRKDGERLLVFYDEVHKFAGSREVVRQIETLVRERRHLGINVVLASQDPMGVPEAVLPLLDAIGVFRHGSKDWAVRLGRAVAPLSAVGPDRTKDLPPGRMWLWAKDWCELDAGRGRFGGEPLLVDTRPRIAQHGGETEPLVGQRSAGP